MRTEASDRQSLYVANEISKRGHQHFALWADYTVGTDVCFGSRRQCDVGAAVSSPSAADIVVQH
jgi:hypothetical protein